MFDLREERDIKNFNVSININYNKNANQWKEETVTS